MIGDTRAVSRQATFFAPRLVQLMDALRRE